MSKYQSQFFGRRTVVAVLLKTLTDDQLAGLLNQWVGADADPALTDREAEAAAWLFDRITDERPELVGLALDK